jgi:hypothetical protein
MDTSARSKFYGLGLAGAGTGDVESLSSYIQRLAFEHQLKCPTLMRMLFGERQKAGLSTLLLHSTGSGKYVADVENATGVRLAAASMARFAAVLPTNALLRREQVHCLLCARASHRYGRLMWHLEAVTACPVHRVSLVRRSCGAPRSEQLRVANRPNLPGVCSLCGSIGFRCNALPRPAFEDELWVAAKARDLLALTDRQVASLSPESLRKGLSVVVEQAFEGMPVVASRRARLGRSTVLRWLQEPLLPSLPALMQFALAAEASIVELLRGEYHCTRRISSESVSNLRERTYIRHDWHAIEAALSAALTAQDALSVAAIARSLGVDESALRRRYPAQINALYARAAARRAAERRKCRDKAFAVYSAAAEGLLAEGHTVCRKTLERKSGLATFGQSGPRMSALFDVLQKYASNGSTEVDQIPNRV